MNLKQVREFKEKYEVFLRVSNVNLGRESKRKEGFIAEAMKMVLDFVLSEPDQTSEPEDVDKTTSQSDRMLSIKPTKELKKLVGPKGVTAMTGPESKRADEQLGTSRSVE